MAIFPDKSTCRKEEIHAQPGIFHFVCTIATKPNSPKEPSAKACAPAGPMLFPDNRSSCKLGVLLTESFAALGPAVLLHPGAFFPEPGSPPVPCSQQAGPLTCMGRAIQHPTRPFATAA